MVTKEGRTPLSTALFHGHEEVSLLMLENCTPGREYFVSDVPVLELATKVGSKRLLEGVADQVGGWDEFVVSSGDGATPLHYLLPSAGPNFVQYLLARFDIHQARQDGMYPIETVLDNLPESWKRQWESIESLRLLVTSDIVQSIKDSGRDIWTQFCTVLSRGLDRCAEANRHTEPMIMASIEGVTKVLIENGALAAYEGRYDESGVIPLIDACLEIYETNHDIIWPTTQIVVQRSGLFGLAAHHPSIRRLMDILLHDPAVADLVFLLEHGADPFTTCEGYPRPLIKDVCNSKITPELFRTIAETITKKSSEKGTPEGETLLSLLSDLITSGPSGREEKIRYILSAGVDLNTAYRGGAGNHFRHPIIEAASSKQFGIVRLLLTSGTRLDSLTFDDGDLLSFASRFGEVELIKKIRAMLPPTFAWGKTTKHAIYEEGSDEFNYLHLACWGSSLAVARYYLEEELFGQTPTADAGDVNSTNINWASPRFRNTPLHIACRFGSKELVELLVEKGAKLTLESYREALPIDHALWSGRMDTAKLLLGLGSPTGQRHHWSDAQIRKLQEESHLTAAAKGSKGHLLLLFESAILSGSIDRLEELGRQSNFSLVNHPVPSCQICTALLRALTTGGKGTVLWLLQNGASTSRRACLKHTIAGGFDPIILTDLTFPGLLDAILDMYLRDRYCWLRDPLNIIHVTVLWGDITGLNIIHSHLMANSKHYW